MAWNYHCEICGAALDPGEKCDCQAREKRRTVTMKDWQEAGDFSECAKPGDAVEEAIVDEFLGCVPPVVLRADLMQCGEPANHMEDPRTGKWRATFTTFAKRGDAWYYCGKCFAGDTVEPEKLAG